MDSDGELMVFFIGFPWFSMFLFPLFSMVKNGWNLISMVNYVVDSLPFTIASQTWLVRSCDVYCGW